MRNTIILSRDKETAERLRLLINTLFPEVEVFCVSDLRGCSEKCSRDLDPNKRLSGFDGE